MEEEERLSYSRTKHIFRLQNSYSFVVKIYLSSIIWIFLTIYVHGETIQAPRFTTQPSAASRIVNEGTTKVLQCRANGYPLPVYKWIKDGQELGDFSPENYYKIQSARREDAGSYQCIARNAAGSILSQKLDVAVAYMGKFSDLTEKIVSVEAGQAAILDLPPIESYPEPLVTWQTDQNTYTSSNLDIITGITHQLIILSTSEIHQKSYRAHVTNTQIGKDEYSPFIRLIVRGGSTLGDIPPEIIIRPKNLDIVKGKQSSDLHCFTNARPLYSLETVWLKDSIPVENAGISYQLNDPWNRTLSLYNANLTHTGKYTCNVKLRNALFPSVEAEAQVTVLEPPLFTNNLRQETLAEYNSVVKLPCEAIGIPLPNITWYRNAVEITKITHHSRYFIEEGGTLVIKKLNIEDSGLFQCIASNDAGSDFLVTWLKVKAFAPIVESSPQNVTLLDGKDVVLPCRVAGAPTPNVTWLYYDMQTVEQTNRFQYLELGDLLITSVRVEDAGKYTCIRSNEAGRVEASAYLSVLVRTQIIQPPADTRVLLGHDATLKCKVSGDPTILYQINWFHNNRPIVAGNQRIKITADGTLEIHAVRPSDVGEYTCYLNSLGGNDTRTAKLNVIELPFSPTLVRAERVDHRSVNVSWAHAFNGNSPILKYIIQRREVPDIGPILDPLLNWVTELNNVSANENSVILTNLKAASSYQFRVSAVNSVGEGSPSDPSNVVQLPQEPPSGPPIGFAGSARSSTEIITQWQPPLEDSRNGRILGYIIRYKLYGYNDSPWTIQNVTNEAQKNFLIQELITWKDYILQIAAYNEKGVGVFSDGIKIKTKEGVPEMPPDNVTVKSLSSTAVQVWWKPPNPQHVNGINQGYKLQAWRGEIVSKMIAVPPSLFDPLAEQTATINSLEKFTEYNITVLCFTDPGDGPASEPVTVLTHEDVPDEISNLQFHNISDRSVTVVWNPPKHANGVLVGYSVLYMIKDRPDTLKSENVTENITHITINNLMPTTHYKFEAYAWTRIGFGPSKVATIQSGVEPVLPQPPTKLAITNIEAFSVVLQFTPGFDGNSSITKWIVEAQTARNTSWFPVYEESNPEATTLTVINLIPFTTYRLRLIAVNVVGPSEPSDATKEFQTIQAPPAHPPWNVTVRAMSAKELRVRWIPLQQTEWFGNARGYNITFREIALSPNVTRETFPKTITIEDPTSNSYILDNLEEYAQYEVIMIAFNDVGFSAPSPVALERTRESVPSSGPLNVLANATSSTTIIVQWGNVPVEDRNGQIEGFKVCYSLVSRLSHPVLFKDISSNSTFTTTLTKLRKFSQYNIQVLAYTRLGDGALSNPVVRVQTFEDTPGPPSNVSFPDVSLTSAKIIWDVPEEPNGEILAYRVDYYIKSSGNQNYSRTFPPSDRTFLASALESEQYYLFSVTAQTRLGWGKTAQAVVYTTNNREHPQPPSIPHISRSEVQATQITFSWTPGRDGFAPLRYYTIQKSENAGPWVTVPQRVDPSVTSYTVTDLKPFTNYRFRIQATNDIGPSAFSHESPQVRTLPAAPTKGVENVKVVPITTTSVHVHWKPIEESYWSGDYETGGYSVLFQPVSDYPVSLQMSPKQQLRGIAASEVILNDLTRDRNYEIVVVPYNSQGSGPPSPPITVYVGEAVPTGQPQNVEAEAVSATEVRLKWLPPQQNQQNGDLLGYKIFYLVVESPQEEDNKIEEETEVVPATYLSHSLIFLDKYTKYKIQMLAFNPAGDGPRSDAIFVKTHQGIPGPPTDLSFSEITMNSFRVSWQPPKKKNGELTGYIVTYETVEQNEIGFSKQVKQKVTETSIFVQTLEEQVTYMFSVRAQTIDYGPPAKGNVTTGPQDGSPLTPRELTLAKTISSVEIRWVNGPSGKGPILGYIIQSKRRDDSRWMTVVRTTNGPLEEYLVSYQSLLPSTMYSFRVIAYNKFGISCPVTSEDVVLTPSKLYLEYGYLKMPPFYQQSWFMVALAAGSIIVIIIVVAVLCVKSKSYKYKKEAQKSLEVSLAMDMDDRHQLAMEMYRSRRMSSGTINRTVTAGSSSGTLKRNTLNRKSQIPPNVPPLVGKSPPRPSPANVVYHSDEESLKGYDENPDDSSLTEKASELSSSDQASESENESIQSDPHSFVNHYANVNDSLRQSWKRQKPVRNYSSYTDSEPEGSAVVSLNGGQIVMNNMARSRAPLPGFSSFV